MKIEPWQRYEHQGTFSLCWYIIEMSSINEAILAYFKQILHYYFSFGIVITVLSRRQLPPGLKHNLTADNLYRSMVVLAWVMQALTDKHVFHMHLSICNVFWWWHFSNIHENFELYWHLVIYRWHITDGKVHVKNMFIG